MTFISPNEEKKLKASPLKYYPSNRFIHYGYVYPNVIFKPSYVKRTYPRI